MTCVCNLFPGGFAVLRISQLGTIFSFISNNIILFPAQNWRENRYDFMKNQKTVSSSNAKK